jgi:AbrB family looped-hinge helix DNA binding protein
MRIEVTMTERGGITIPAAMRHALGLTGNDRLIVEDTAEGLLLRPAISVPIEIYSEERIAEFAEDETALERYFADKTGDDDAGREPKAG